MTKQEAQRKLNELQKIIDSLPDSGHPKYKKGQVYCNKKSGALFLLRSDGDRLPFELVDLTGTSGNFYRAGCCFDNDEEDFVYVGMFNEVFKRVDIT